MLFKNLIFMFSVLSLCAGCTFYEAGVKNKPELFTDIQNVPTYTSSYFGCATPVSNNKPLSSQGYKLFYDSNHELWLECRGAGYNEFFRAHMGPASFTKEGSSAEFVDDTRFWQVAKCMI